MTRKITKKQEILRQGEFTIAHTDFHKALSTYASFKVSDRALGEDLVQDTFIKTWGYLVKKGKIDGMRAFLYHILNNLIIDEYRKRKYKAGSLDDLMDQGFAPSVDNSERLSNTLDGKAALLLIKDLPEIYQKVVHMRYVQELTLHEMSVITGQTENTLSVRIHRGVCKLRLLYNTH